MLGADFQRQRPLEGPALETKFQRAAHQKCPIFRVFLRKTKSLGRLPANTLEQAFVACNADRSIKHPRLRAILLIHIDSHWHIGSSIDFH
jgi:hypothetical protein